MAKAVCDIGKNKITLKWKELNNQQMHLFLLQEIGIKHDGLPPHSCNDDSIVKLFFQKSNTYLGNTANWGNTKGLDHFNYVFVVLNPISFKAFEEGKLIKLNPTTRNKFYVACTRARGDLYFIPEERLKAYRR